MIQFDTIFLVDDDPINNLINKRLLGKIEIGQQILEFLDSGEALKKLKEVGPNQSALIFLDINMPVMNGWEFLEKYEEANNYTSHKIIILSSSIDYQDKFRAQSFKSVSGFLEKPLTPQKIKDLIDTFD